MRRLLSLVVLTFTITILSGCNDQPLPTGKPDPSAGASRARPGEDGKIEKGEKGAPPKGAMKPIAD